MVQVQCCRTCCSTWSKRRKPCRRRTTSAVHVQERNDVLCSCAEERCRPFTCRRKMSSVHVQKKSDVIFSCAEEERCRLFMCRRRIMSSVHVQEKNTNLYRTSDTLFVWEAVVPKTPQDDTITPIDWTNLPDDTNLLVDSLFLQLLETKTSISFNPLTTPVVRKHLAKRLSEKQLTFVIPVGWIDGITLFNQRQLLASDPTKLSPLVASFTQGFIDFVLRQQVDKPKDLDEIDFRSSEFINKFLKTTIVSRLADALGVKEIDQRAVVWLNGQLPPITYTQTPREQVNGLVKFLAPFMPSWAGFLGDVSLWLPEKNQQLRQEVLKFLLNEALVFSFNTLATLTNGLFVKLTKPNEIFFSIPARSKSYSVVYQIFFMNNEVDAAQFFPYRPKKDIEPLLPDIALNFAILDDVSISGYQLGGASCPDNSKKPLHSCQKAALIVTEPAAKFTHALKITTDDGSDPVIRSMDDMGFGMQSVAISLPYMAPDNNGPSGAKILAPLFTPIPAVKDMLSKTVGCDYNDDFDNFATNVIKRLPVTTKTGHTPHAMVWL
eukprot:gnl/Spiro4/29611_TR14519_c0_g1_i1.p1 gnl/Spiro4/29611_TR14519_c0_g1~~gnl/Spiro4/29611_TR14519_c0_g1_i1.p1  ORF type:complete len:549 (-),score=112.05 gnl/Spiro4/29611_TR14519_c0_g1_i1:118-1764(-)